MTKEEMTALIGAIRSMKDSQEREILALQYEDLVRELREIPLEIRRFVRTRYPKILWPNTPGEALAVAEGEPEGSPWWTFWIILCQYYNGSSSGYDLQRAYSNVLAR